MSESDHDPTNAVDVYNISPNTQPKGLHDFFSFCGAITTIEMSQGENGLRKAHIVFATDTAGETAVMLDGGTLDGCSLHVKLPITYSAGEESDLGYHERTPDDTVGQEHKPRTAIVAEILAHGYSLTDDVTKRAIEFDNRAGLSDRFKGYLASLDRSLGERVIKGTSNEPTTGKTEGTPSGPLAAEAASEKSAQQTPLPGTTAGHEDKFTTTVPQPDAKAERDATQGTAQQPSLLRHVQGQVQTQLDRPEIKSKTDFAWTRLTEYYTAIANHPRIHDLYTKTSKTVSDVHEEARRIAEERKKGGASGAAGTSAPSA